MGPLCPCSSGSGDGSVVFWLAVALVILLLFWRRWSKRGEQRREDMKEKPEPRSLFEDSPVPREAGSPEPLRAPLLPWKAVVIAGVVVLTGVVFALYPRGRPAASGTSRLGSGAAMAPSTFLSSFQVDETAPTVGEKYPHLASAALTHARLMPLPDGVLLRAGDLVICQSDLDAEIAQQPAELRAALRKNAFFLLEQTATRKLLVQEARQKGGDAGGDERALLNTFVGRLVEGVTVSDAEIVEFYEKNREMVGAASLAQVGPQIKQYLLQQKQQRVLEQQIRTLAQRMPVAVSAEWAREQAEKAMDNPVDRARASGKPTFANFGAKGCIPCDMMEPVRQAVAKKYEGRLNVVFVHVQKEPVLATRYGVQSIPLLIFFDAQGNEVFRHTGFLAQEKVEEQLARMGVR